MMEMTYDKGTWVFTDLYGNRWRLTPTGDRSMPITITLEQKAPLIIHSVA